MDSRDGDIQALLSTLEKIKQIREAYSSIEIDFGRLQASYKPIYFEDHNTLDHEIDEDEYDDCMVVDAKRRFATIGLKQYPIETYLGEEWVERFVMSLNDTPTITTPESFSVQLHDWQRHGAAKLHKLALSPIRGGICGDAMGLGKTIVVITLMELARKERGLFSLYVCPASCGTAVRNEILAVYKEGYAPKVLILDDSRITASALAEGQWDIVICSYNFLNLCYNRQLEFDKKMDLFRSGDGTRPPRPVGGLYSNFWKLNDLPIRRLILDECQSIKKKHGKRFQSVQALHRRATFLLSGTILSNRWFDVANPVAMLSGHPFDTWQKFMDAFTLASRTTRTMEYGEPDVVSLQRFLAEEEKVKEATFKYERARKVIAKSGIEDAESKRVLGFAVIAMLQSAHSLLVREDVPDVPVEFLELDDDDTDDLVLTLTQMQSQDSNLKTRKEWLKQLDTLNTAELLQSSRVRALIRLIRHIKSKWPDEKVVIFSTFLRFLDIISRTITATFGEICLEFNGTMDSKAKTEAQEAFQTEKDCKFILITSGCGGVGLNLQSGSIVIQTEVWWNRNLELQSYARCYRQGQQHNVKIFRMLASNSAIESSIKSCQSRKEKQNNEIMDVLIRKDDTPLYIPTYPS